MIHIDSGYLYTRDPRDYDWKKEQWRKWHIKPGEGQWYPEFRGGRNFEISPKGALNTEWIRDKTAMDVITAAREHGIQEQDLPSQLRFSDEFAEYTIYAQLTNGDIPQGHEGAWVTNGKNTISTTERTGTLEDGSGAFVVTSNRGKLLAYSQLKAQDPHLPVIALHSHPSHDNELSKGRDVRYRTVGSPPSGFFDSNTGEDIHGRDSWWKHEDDIAVFYDEEDIFYNGIVHETDPAYGDRAGAAIMVWHEARPVSKLVEGIGIRVIHDEEGRIARMIAFPATEAYAQEIHDQEDVIPEDGQDYSYVYSFQDFLDNIRDIEQNFSVHYDLHVDSQLSSVGNPLDDIELG